MESSDCECGTDESKGAYGGDVKMGEVPENPSCKLIDINRCIDLLRLVFKQGMAFLDNGSGAGLLERMLVGMPGYVVDKIFENPAVAQRDAPGRMRVMTPTLETDIAHTFAKETRKAISKEIQGDFFGIYVDVCSQRNTGRNYMVLFARYVNGKGDVVERLLGIVPEPHVSGPSLKVAVHSMLSEAGLSSSSMRAQGYGLGQYDGEVLTELKSLFTGENASAHYVHPHVCPLHSLLITASFAQFDVYELFKLVDMLSNLIEDSPQFNEKLRTLVQERGLNLDNDLGKAGETNWGSYYEAIVKFAAYFSPICDALDFVGEVSSRDTKFVIYEICGRLSYDLVFALLLMQDVLGVTNELSLALDRKDWDADHCVALLQESKKQLQVMRDEGWPPFLNKVGMFCNENDVDVVTMGEKFKKKAWRVDEPTAVTNLDYYHVDFFQQVINSQLEELDRRFTKESWELVLLASHLNPRNSFRSFDKDKLVGFARLYASEFSDYDIAALDLELQAFITDASSDTRFSRMNMLSDLSVLMVETGKNVAYPLVYLLVKLALILSGTPTTVKATSTALKFIDNTMREDPCNQWISDCLLLYLEPDVVKSITNDVVIASL
jgi:hypothetical protein